MYKLFTNDVTRVALATLDIMCVPVMAICTSYHRWTLTDGHQNHLMTHRISSKSRCGEFEVNREKMQGGVCV